MNASSTMKKNLQLHLKELKIYQAIFLTIKENEMTNAQYGESDKVKHMYMQHKIELFQTDDKNNKSA